MSQAREGLYATLYLADGTAAISNTNTVAMLTGVDISWTAAKKRFYSCGSLVPESVLDGVMSWEGSFKRAYFCTKYAGSVQIGTCRFLGSISARGTVQPSIFGTLVLTGGNLSNMAAESNDAVTEEEGFILYAVSTLG